MEPRYRFVLTTINRFARCLIYPDVLVGVLRMNACALPPGRFQQGSALVSNHRIPPEGQPPSCCRLPISKIWQSQVQGILAEVGIGALPIMVRSLPILDAGTEYAWHSG
jgi:hypothetical protein